MEEAKITCIGGANLDRKAYLLGELQMQSSNPVQTSYSFGGVARNVAENLTRLKCSVSLVTVLGDDFEGKSLQKEMELLGIDLQSSSILSGGRTGVFTTVNDQDGDMALALADMEICDTFTINHIQSIWSRIAKTSFIFLDTNFPKEPIHWIIQQAKKENIPLYLDPVSIAKSQKLPDDLSGVHTIFPNLHEGEALTQISASSSENLENRIERYRQIGEALLERGVQQVVLTLGEQGVLVVSREEKPQSAVGSFHLRPKLGKVIDTTGAGDSLTAGFIWGQCLKKDLMHSALLGMKVSALTIQSKQTVSPDLSPDLVFSLT